MTRTKTYAEIVTETARAVRRGLADGSLRREDGVVHAAQDRVREAAEAAGFTSASGIADLWDEVDVPAPTEGPDC